MSLSQRPMLEICSNFQIMDVENIQCLVWNRRSCYINYTVMVLVVAFVVLLNIGVVALLISVFRKIFCAALKKKLHTLNETREMQAELCDEDETNRHITPVDKSAVLIYYDKGEVAMLVDFDFRDTKFVNELLMPGLMKYGKTQIESPTPKSITIPSKKEKLLKWFKDCVCPPSHILIIVFSPNFLMSQYSHVDIKKIQSKMARQVNSVFVFVDIGPENSVYTFLKDQRDRKNSVAWDEPNFWEKIAEIVDVEKIAVVHERSEDVLRVETDGHFEFSSNSYVDADGRRSYYNLSSLQKKVISTVEYKV